MNGNVSADDILSSRVLAMPAGIHPADIARFLSRVELNSLTGCWLWTAECAGGGYGRFSYQRRKWQAHRFAFMAFVGEVRPEEHVHHWCRCRRCVCPWHLSAVNAAWNEADGQVCGNAERVEVSFTGGPLDGYERMMFAHDTPALLVVRSHGGMDRYQYEAGVYRYLGQTRTERVKHAG